MLPRRHILDVWESTTDEDDRPTMSAGTLAIDAIKYLNIDPHRDHLVEALDLNEFVCYVHPDIRPNNRSLLFHVVSDLLGLLLYGIPKKRRSSIENLEIIDYSSKNASYPVLGVWHYLKGRIAKKRDTGATIVDGFINKIRIEMYIVDNYPFVDDVFLSSRQQVEGWLPSLSDFYRRRPSDILEIYDKWSALWHCKGEREKILDGMIERLSFQAKRDLGMEIDKESVKISILNDTDANRRESERYSRFYKEGVELLFAI